MTGPSLLFLSVIVLLILLLSVVDAQTGTNGTINKRFWIVQANNPPNAKAVTFGNFPNGQIVNVSSNTNFTNNPLGLVIPTKGSFFQLSMTTSMLTPNVMTTYDDRNVLYAVGQDKGNNFTEIKDLKVNGVKTVFIEGYDSLFNVYTTFNLTFTIIGGTERVNPAPTQSPSSRPSSRPSAKPSSQPSKRPVVPVTIYVPITSPPSAKPVARPSQKPSTKPSSKPYAKPSSRPSTKPTSKPSAKPSSKPSARPSSKPSAKPSARPSSRPSSKPSVATKASAPNSFTGTFAIVQAGVNLPLSSITLGTYNSGANINISPFSSQSLSLSLNYICCFSKVVLTYSSPTTSFVQNEGTAPYALLGNNGQVFNAVADLSVIGTKSLIAVGYASNGTAIANITFIFTILTSPTPAPVKAPTAAPVPIAPVAPTPPAAPTLAAIDALKTGRWIETNPNAPIQPRHETCFVMVGRVAVLIAGRNSNTKPPYIYNPVNRTWKSGSLAPGNIELHHFQCVVVSNKIWIVAAWTGWYPQETNAPNTYTYDPFLDKWETLPGMPLSRRRGSAATVAIGTDIYVAFGNSGGHETATWSTPTSYSWLDKYDTITRQWTVLADGNFPRDHTGGAFVNGLICVGGGRNGGKLNWPPIPQTECYNITTNTWTIMPNISLARGGGCYGSFDCAGYNGGLLVAGGELNLLGIAVNNTDLFNGTHWISLPILNHGRHSTGLAVDCQCKAIYIASGSTSAGGGPETQSIETYFWNGVNTPCLA